MDAYTLWCHKNGFGEIPRHEANRKPHSARWTCYAYVMYTVQYVVFYSTVCTHRTIKYSECIWLVFKYERCKRRTSRFPAWFTIYWLFKNGNSVGSRARLAYPTRSQTHRKLHDSNTNTHIKQTNTREQKPRPLRIQSERAGQIGEMQFHVFGNHTHTHSLRVRRRNSTDYYVWCDTDTTHNTVRSVLTSYYYHKRWMIRSST